MFVFFLFLLLFFLFFIYSTTPLKPRLSNRVFKSSMALGQFFFLLFNADKHHQMVKKKIHVVNSNGFFEIFGYATFLLAPAVMLIIRCLTALRLINVLGYTNIGAFEKYFRQVFTFTEEKNNDKQKKFMPGDLPRQSCNK